MSQRSNRIVSVFAALLIFCRVGTASAESVTLEAGSETPIVETGAPRTLTVRALVKPSRAVTNRAPLAIALVVDKSGSMGADGKMENAKRGALEALELLRREDMAAVVAYDSEAFVLVEATPADKTDSFRRAVSRLKAGGNTGLYYGVSSGAAEIERLARKGYIPRIILLSDGLANVGPSSVRELAALGRELANREITITTIGLGLDYDEDLMTALASESGGNSYFAKTGGMLPDIFRRDMEDAVTLTGRSVRVTFTCGDLVRPIGTIGREGTVERDKIETRIYNLYGAEKYAMFELEIPDMPSGTTLRAGTVRVEYTDPSSGGSVVLTSPLDVKYTDDPSEAAGSRSEEIAAQAEMAKNARIREDVVRLADEGRSDEAVSLLRSRAEDMSMKPIAASAPMQAEITEFEALASEIEESGAMSNEQRKYSLNSAYISKNQQSAVSEDAEEDRKDQD
ncbi:MAG: VWA domain-containing protein [Synergistaceae bacterium]|jgi:Ca-activated chloride channel family protein|nr:VWA domain-containing protein [Synergistaceae bacterium]